MRIALFAAVFLFCAHTSAAQAACGIVEYFDEPLGGAAGYRRTIADYDVYLDEDSDLESLISALNNSQTGEIIFIDGDAEIDFGNTRDVTIPAGVTLASDRGVDGSHGARLYTSNFGGTLMVTDGDSVRITGLRLEGPSQTTEELESTNGIRSAHNDLEVDNCELYGFTFAPIATAGNALIAHNNIHHNQESRLGYGVVLDGSDNQMVEIFGNVFNANRHAVAATGQRGQTYEAHNNLVLWVANGHVFDMHAECEPGQPVYGSPWAGNLVEIRNNYVLTSSQSAVTIRGSPYSAGSNIVENYFARNDDPIEVDRQVRQSSWPSGQHEGDPYCLEVQNEAITNYDSNSPDYNCYETSLWLIGLGATDHYQILNDNSDFISKYLDFGDFDGDGVADAFMTSEGNWHVSWRGRSSWERVNSFNSSVESLRLGDFDGDGKTDVFQKIGSNWRVSWNARSSWEIVGSSTSVPLEDLRFGDFNGDGRADVLHLADKRWEVSFSQQSRQGMTSWQVVRSFHSNVGAAEDGRGSDITKLRFGDFDGDGATDVFTTDGGMWWVSHGQKDCDILGGCHFGPWTEINTSTHGVESMALADVDGDGKTDILQISDGRFRAAYGGRGTWQWRGEAPPAELDTLVFQDFTGDGRDDVFYSFQDA